MHILVSQLKKYYCKYDNYDQMHIYKKPKPW